jgi:hypothetical protein
MKKCDTMEVRHIRMGKNSYASLKRWRGQHEEPIVLREREREKE